MFDQDQDASTGAACDDAALVAAAGYAGDLASWGPGALAAAVGAWCRERSRLEEVGARLLAAWDAAGGWGLDGAVSAQQWLRHRGEVADGAARLRVARTLRDHAPVTARAWSDGRLSAAKAALVAEVATDDVLVEFAACEEVLVDTVAALTLGQARTWLRRWLAMAQDAAGVDRATRDHDARQARVWEGFQGLVALEAQFDPVTGAAVKAALEAHEDRLFRADVAAARADAGLLAQEPGETPLPEGLRLERTAGQRRADALAELVQAGARTLGHLDDTGLGGPSAHLVVTADAVSLLAAAQDPGPAGDDPRRDVEDGGPSPRLDPDGLRGGAVTVDGLDTPLVPSLAAMLACDCTLTTALLDSQGVPLSFGRSRRLASPAQRRALVLRDGATCAHPGCDRPVRWCDAHHIHHWLAGGPTDVDNLVLLCRNHHRAIHARDPGRRWHVALDPTSRRPHFWRHHDPAPDWHRRPAMAAAHR